jgi:hypothetical protein
MEKLKKEIERRSEQDFLSHMRKHNRIEPFSSSLAALFI